MIMNQKIRKKPYLKKEDRMYVREAEGDHKPSNEITCSSDDT